MNERIRNTPLVDKSINQFQSALERLNGSMIQVTDKQEISHVTVVNPSVNDFLQNYLTENQNEIALIRESLVHYSQLLRCFSKAEHNVALKCLTKNHSIQSLIFPDEHSRINCITSTIVKHSIYDLAYQQIIYAYLGQYRKMYTRQYRNRLSNVFV